MKITIFVAILMLIPISAAFAETFESPNYEKTIWSTSNGTYTRSFSQLTNIVIDSNDNVYLVDGASLYVMSSDDEFISFFSRGVSNVQFNSNNEIYTVRDNSIKKISPTGEILELWSVNKRLADVTIDFSEDANLFLFIDNEDNLLISEYIKDENNKNGWTVNIKKYSPQGIHLGTLTDIPHPLAQDDQGYFYGRTNDTIIKYDSQGNIKNEFDGKVVDLDIFENILYAARPYKNPVLFSLDGNPFLSFGNMGIGEDRFGSPRGIAVNSEGRIYVIDYARDKILTFSPYVGSSELNRSVDLDFDAKKDQIKYDQQIYANILKSQSDILPSDNLTEDEIQTHSLTNDKVSTVSLICNNELNKFQKYDGSLVCIKSISIQKLIERGYITKIMPVDSEKFSDFNSRILFDQDEYTAPDTVFVTILSVDHNKDPKLVEEINPTTDLVEIRTAKSFVNEFRFVETGPDTGIFKGQFEIETMHDYNNDKTIHTDENLIVKSKDTIMISVYIERFDVKLVGNGLMDSN